jgi:hypothetical protein
MATECTDLRASATCVPGPALCGVSAAPDGICAVECTSNVDCETGERCAAGFCRARLLDGGSHDGGADAARTFDAGHDAATTDAGTGPGFDAGFDAAFDASYDAGFDGGLDAGFDGGFDAGSSFDSGFDAGGPADSGFDAAAVADGSPTDAAISPRVIGPAETVTVFPSVYLAEGVSAGPCSPSCVDGEGTVHPIRVHPFTTTASMQFTSWFWFRTVDDGARESLREGATCLSSTAFPDIVARVLPAGTYEAIVCDVGRHSMVVEPVPPLATHTSCAAARPIALYDVVHQVRDASTDRFYFRVTVPAPPSPEDPPEIWDGIALTTPLMTSASVRMTIRSVCADPATTLDTVDIDYLMDIGGPWRIRPLLPGSYSLILEVPRGLEFRMRPVDAP